MSFRNLALLSAMPALLLCMACSHQQTTNNTSYKDQVKQALQQADLTDVTVSEDKDENTITLGGSVHSDNAKNDAGNVAQAAAGSRIIVNKVSVRPAGAESAAKDMASSVDDGIESNYKAVLIANGLDKQRIGYDAKNGVLTLKGTVNSTSQRQEAQQLAQSVPNVQQVLNQLKVKR